MTNCYTPPERSYAYQRATNRKKNNRLPHH